MVEVKYVVRSADHGGWDKKHVWAVTKDANGGYWGRSTPLCRAPKAKSINYDWYMKFQTPITPESHPNPLEEYPHFCMECHCQWHSIVKASTKEKP